MEGMPPREPFRFSPSTKEILRQRDMSPEACRQRLESFRRDRGCALTLKQIAEDEAVLARERVR